MINKLTSLSKITIIAADTIDIEAIKFYKPKEVTTNPSLIFKAIKNLEYKNIINQTISWVKKKSYSPDQQIINVCDKFMVNVGSEILKLIPGRISMEIDAIFSYDTNACINKARRIIKLYNDSGFLNNRILIKIPATWQGIKAAEKLEKEGINCNLTLLFSFAQAKACAESGVYLISPFVGRILDWHKNNFAVNDKYKIDPGVLFVKKIYRYYKKYNYKTLVMGASFRNIDQILDLAGCDKLTISPNFLKELFKLNGKVIRKLNVNNFIQKKPKTVLTESNFYLEHNFDKMASQMLNDGIYRFFIDQQKLKKIFLFYLNLYN